MRGSIAFPCASNSFEMRCQSMVLTRATTRSAGIVIASLFLVDVFIDLLTNPYEDKLTKNPVRNTPFLAFKFHESEFYANRCPSLAKHVVCSGDELRALAAKGVLPEANVGKVNEKREPAPG